MGKTPALKPNKKSGVQNSDLSFGNKDVVKEAKRKNRGGEVKVTGRAAGGRLDRKRGGSIGKSPFSSAGGGSASKSPFFK